MNLSEAIEYTFINRRQWAKSKNPQTARINTAHGLRILGDIPVGDIKRRHFHQIQQSMEADGKQPATANRVCAAVHTVLTCMHLHEFLDAVPSYEQLPEPESKRSYYTKEEIAEFIRRAPEVTDGQLLQDSIRFALWLAERQGEMLKLTWDRVDLENRVVLFEDVKTGGDHSLPIRNDELFEMLQRRYHERIDDEVFPWSDRGQLIKRFKELKKLCGHCPKADKHRLWHTLRHTAATWMVESGVPIRTVMTVLNHKQVSTTLRYAKTTDEAKAAGLDAIAI